MDLMTRRRALLARVESGGEVLPTDYQKVAYLQTTDGAFIKTDIPAELEISYEAALELPTAGDQIFISCNKGNQPVGGLGYYNRMVQHWYGGYFVIGTAVEGKAVYKIDISNGHQVAYINGTEAGTAAKSISNYSDTSQNVHLFTKISLSGTGRNNFTGKCYWAKVYVDGELVGHFIPCYRKIDDVIGMYDLVSNHFYTNTVGTFIKGPDIN